MVAPQMETFPALIINYCKLTKTAVVILNWNGIRYKHLSNFLPNVLKHSRADADVIVADNHSDDDSISYLKDHHPEVRIIENPSNNGFSSGYNLALKQIEAEYYVLLNSDIIIPL